MYSRALPLVLGLCIGGCAEEANREAVPATVRLSARPAIGSHTGEGPKAFGRVGDVEIGHDGSIFVLDRMNRVIQVFDQSGAHLRSIGRRGGGPGEFDNPVALTWGPHGALWVVDPGNNRYTVFTPKGELVTTYRRPAEGVVGDWPGGFSPDGHLFDVTFRFGPKGPEEVLVEYELLGDRLVEVKRHELPVRPRSTFEIVSRPGELTQEEIPFASQPIWQIGPDGALWYGETGDFIIRRRDLGNGTERLFGRTFEPPEVADEERRDALAALEAFTQRGGVVDSRLIPTVKPPLLGIFFDDRGYLWVVRSPKFDPNSDVELVDVYHPNGTFVDSARGDFILRPRPRVRGDLLITVLKAEHDVDFIALYRVLR